MTTTSTTPTKIALSDAIRTVTDAYVTTLQAGYRGDLPRAVGTLARLRRGAGKTPAQAPELYGLTGAELIFQKLSRQPTPAEAEAAEMAMFLAVTLYALHQQSSPGQNMHRAGVELGAAVRAIMPHGEIDETLRQRFVQVGTATGVDVLAYRLREIVSLLRRQSQPLDYGLLAQQLYQAQLPDGMSRVRQSWGHSFHAYKPPRATGEAGRDGDTPRNEEEDR